MSKKQKTVLTPSSNFDGKRIYAVVADTVQNPLHVTNEGQIKVTSLSKVIKQPLGRQSAQLGHVVSQVRVKMILNTVFARRIKKDIPISNVFVPITTIHLQCRDCLELQHVFDLLQDNEIQTEIFYDQNQDAYGPGFVPTAIATWPVKPEEVQGITDYLPLFLSEMR